MAARAAKKSTMKSTKKSTKATMKKAAPHKAAPRKPAPKKAAAKKISAKKTKENTISSESVLKATGKDWTHWFGVLDSFDGTTKKHAEMATHLATDHGVASWWQQMIVVQYERARGMRAVGQTSRGFEAQVSRTINVPVARAWEAWSDAAQLGTWFTTKAKNEFRVGGRYSNDSGDAGEYLRIVPQKFLRFTWEQKCHQPGSVVEVTFERRDANRCVVRLTHTKLKSADDMKNLKEGWSWALDSLKSFLETGKPVQYDEWERARKDGA